MTQLLIDADILAFQAAARNQEANPFAEGGFEADEALAQHQIAREIEDLQEDLGADRVTICLSDPNENWRKHLEPTYKGNRKDTVPPVLLMPLKRWLAGRYPSQHLRWLEADDVMGILQTWTADSDTIIVSEDKDMRTIPGKVYHPNRPSNGVMDVSLTEANQFHLWQTIVGDPTDGYGGCPGVGQGGAYISSPFGHLFKSSPRTVTYAHDLLSETDPLKMWDCVLDAYASKSLPETAAIHQARLASICRATNWDSEAQRVRLWNPLNLLMNQ